MALVVVLLISVRVQNRNMKMTNKSLRKCERIQDLGTMVP